MNEERKSGVVKSLKKRIFDKYDLNRVGNDDLEEVIKQLISEEIRGNISRSKSG